MRLHRLALAAPSPWRVPTAARGRRARIVIDRNARSIYHGRSDTPIATAYDERGQVSSALIRWSSANSGVAWVDSSGVVRALVPGRTTLTAAAGVLSRTVHVTVLADTTKPAMQRIEPSTRTVDLIGGDVVRSISAGGRDPGSGIRSASVTFMVTNARPDDALPTLNEPTFTHERASEVPGEESRVMVISATDHEWGMLTAEFDLDSEALPGVHGCGAERPRPHPFPWTHVPTVSGRRPVPLVSSNSPVVRTISLVRLTVARGNVRERDTTASEALGITPKIDIRT